MPDKTLRRGITFIIGAGVFSILTITLEDLVTTWIHPYNVQLLNAIGRNATASSTPTQGWGNLDLPTLIITIVVVGLLAAFYVGQAQDKTKEAEDKLEKKQYEYERDTRTIYEDMHKKIHELTEDGIRAIQERREFFTMQLESERAKVLETQHKLDLCQRESDKLRENYNSLLQYQNTLDQSEQFHELPPVEFVDFAGSGSYKMRGSLDDVDKIEEARRKIHKS
jgi:hypothetical protein